MALAHDRAAATTRVLPRRVRARLVGSVPQCRYPGGNYGRKYCVESDFLKPLEFKLTSRE